MTSTKTGPDNRRTSIWDRPISHGELLKRIWKKFEDATTRRGNPFHLPGFATVAEGVPKVRTVVLRRFWRNPARLAFHAHKGSPKVAQIQANPKVSWIFYDPVEKFQVRAEGIAKLHREDELAREQWKATRPFPRRCYIGLPPGTASRKPSHGMPESLADREPTLEESEAGWENFVVVSSSISLIDCVELDFEGHRRALFEWDDSGQLSTSWITP